MDGDECHGIVDTTVNLGPPPPPDCELPGGEKVSCDPPTAAS